MSNRNQAKPVAQAQTNQTEDVRSRTTEVSSRQEIRQRVKKPLKLDVSNVQKRIEEDKGVPVKMKWIKYDGVSYHQGIGWQVVTSDMKNQINMYSPDGRLKAKGENIQSADGGAFTADVGGGEHNFLMYKDLETYLAEDARWNKEDADGPMDSIQSAAESGERAGLGGDVKSYQPKQQVTINKQREMY